MMKGFVHVIRCLAWLSLYGLANCNSSTDTSGPTATLTIAIPAMMTSRAQYVDAIAAFQQEYPDVEVRILEIPGNYYQKLLVMIAGKNAPDVMWMGQGFAEFAGRNVFLDLSARIASEVDVSRYQDRALDLYRDGDGRLYGIPFGIDLKLIAYDRSQFEAQGVNLPRNGWSFDEFLAAARKLSRHTDNGSRDRVFGFLGELDFSLFGAAMIDVATSRVTCDSPEMIDYIQTNIDLSSKYRVSPAVRQLASPVDDPILQFRQGRAAMIGIATWDIPFLQQRCADMDWDIVTNPRVRRLSHWASTQGFVVSKSTGEPDQAWQLCKAMFSRPFQESMAGFVLPTDLEVARRYASDESGIPRNREALLVAAETMQPTPRVAYLSEMISYWSGACEQALSGRASPKAAMQIAQKEIEELVLNYDRRRK